MATYSSHTLPTRGGGGGGRFYGGSAGLMEKIHEMLTERECSIFNEGLAAYHKRKDVSRFVESLSLVLYTNGKRQPLVPIRNQFIKPSDLIKFNDLSIKYGIALPLKGNTAKSGKKMFNKTQTGPKVLEIKRDEKGEWGFSIRGGIDHRIGIFVSWVDNIRGGLYYSTGTLEQLKKFVKNPILIRISSNFLHNISTCICIRKCNKNGEFSPCHF